MPVGGQSVLPPAPGTLSLDLSFTGGGFRDQHVQEDALHPEPYRHDLRIRSADFTLGARWGLAPGWGVEALVPFRLNRQRIIFRTLEGVPFTPDPPDHHHTNRTLGGIADPWVVVAAGRTAGPWSFGARAGTSLPLGPTVENPFALGDLGLPHEHVQHGSGTLQPIVSLGVGRRLGAWAATAIGLVRFGAGTNAHGYRPGHQWLGQAFASAGLGVPGATFTLGPSLHHETAETWDGRREEEGNLGRTDLHAEARAAWIPPGWRTGLGAELRVPLWSESTGEQFDVPVSFRLSLSRTIGGPTP